MACNLYTIKVVEQNDFTLVLPLKKRTYVANVPIDEDIDIMALLGCKVTIGGVEFASVLDPAGVQVPVAADALARGTYDIVLTATYRGAEIRAAYFEALQVVKFNSESEFLQYITGSPIVAQAAYVIGGPLTDAELEALKAEWREKIAEAEQAKEEAEEAKREWEEKAADLYGVAQEATSQTIMTRTVEARDAAVISATQAQAAKIAAQAVQILVGTPASGQAATLFAAIAAGGGGGSYPAIDAELAEGKTDVANAIVQVGGQASSAMSLGELADAIEVLNTVGGQVIFDQTLQRPINLAECIMKKADFVGIDDDSITTVTGSFQGFGFQFVRLRKATSISGMFQSVSIPKLYFDICANLGTQTFYGSARLTVLYCPKASEFGSGGYCLGHCLSLIDLIIGEAFAGNVSFSRQQYDPSLAYDSTSTTLCYSTDIDDYGQTFANNWEKWKWCIINHFAANLQDRTGLTAYTITFGSTVLSHFDAEMIAAFTDKNWTLA